MAVFLSSAGLILLLETVLFAGLNERHAENAWRLQESLILQTQRSSETLLRQAERLVVSLAMREDLRRYASGGFGLREYEQFRSSTDLLRLLVTGAIGNYVHSIYLYDERSQRVLNDAGAMDVRYFDDADFASTSGAAAVSGRWLIGRRYGSSTTSVATYVVPVPLSGVGATHLVLNLDESYFVGNFLSPFGGFDTLYAVRDTLGGTVSTVPDTSSWLAAIDSAAGSRSVRLSDDGGGESQAYFVTSNTSSYTGWEYITFTPEDDVRSPAEGPVAFAIGAVLVFLIGAFVLSVFLAQILYAPIRKLSEQIELLRPARIAADPRVDDSGDATVGLDELESIEARFRHVYELNREYQAGFEQSRTIFLERRRWDLVTGRPVDKGDLEELGLGSPLPQGDRFSVVLVEYDPDIAETDHIRLDAYRKVSAWLRDRQPRSFSFPIILPDRSRVVAVARHKADADRAAFLQQLSEDLQYMTRYQFTLVAGIAVSTPDEISVSFRSAETLAERRRFFPDTPVLIDTPNGKAPSGYPNFLEIERRVADFRSAVDRGDVASAREIARDILLGTEMVPDFAYREAKAFQLANALIASMVVNGLEPTDADQGASPWREFADIETAEGMLSHFESWLNRIDEFYRSRDQRTQYRYVARCREFLDTHYRESVSIRAAADAVGINPAYLSTLFKQETGQTFSVYLTNLRISKAQELLSTTNLTIDAVAAESGFLSKQNLTRTCKRLLGCTPGVVRERNRTK